MAPRSESSLALKRRGSSSIWEPWLFDMMTNFSKFPRVICLFILADWKSLWRIGWNVECAKPCRLSSATSGNQLIREASHLTQSQSNMLHLGFVLVEGIPGGNSMTFTTKYLIVAGADLLSDSVSLTCAGFEDAFFDTLIRHCQMSHDRLPKFSGTHIVELSQSITISTRQTRTAI